MLHDVLLSFALLSENILVLQPYGPKMCLELCQSSQNCTSHIYDEVQLNCRLAFNTTTVELSCESLQLNQTGTHQAPGVETTALKPMPVCASSDVKLFHEACIDGDLVEVKRLVCQRMVGVNCPEDWGKTAIMLAAEEKQEIIFDFLVQQKADHESFDQHGFNVLHYACASGSTYIVKKLLVDHKMDIECMNGDDYTPLMQALHHGYIPLVKLLIERGADIRPNEYRDTILHEACSGGYVDMVKYVLSLNVTEIDNRGADGRTPLMCAVLNGDVSVVKLLKSRGADVGTVDTKGGNILLNACQRYHVDMVKYILTLNIVDIECRGQFGRTSLLYSVLKGELETVKILTDGGADIRALDKYNNNILHLACEGGNDLMVKYVLSFNVSDIEARGRFGRTPLMIAVHHHHIAVVSLLYIHYNASITKSDEFGSNVLHLACKRYKSRMIKYLVTLDELRGFERKKNKKGLTPLHLARKEGLSSFFSVLRQG